MNLIFRRAPLFLLLFLSGITLFAQPGSSKKVKLVHSDEWSYDQSVSDAQRLIGNVELEYQGTRFYCDSAYLYSNDDFDAFSSIRIQGATGYTVTGELMHFVKKENTAQLLNKIVLRDKEMTLSTNQLNYNLDTQVASYFGGGKIISSANNNVLTSAKGFYNGNTQVFFFRKNVVLTNPDYTVTSDTMQYNNLSEVTYFFGPTNIKGEKSNIYCENGYYNTRQDQSRFGKNAQITSDKTVLRGDSIFYNGKTGVGEVFRNVEIRDTTNNYLISGAYGRHDENTKRSFVTGRALMTQIMEDDSLYLHADTLHSVQDSSGNDLLLAYHGVRFFKKDLQGKCDSLSYSTADSTLHMYRAPLLWSDENQVSGDSISIRRANGQLQSLEIRNRAIIVSAAIEGQDTLDISSPKYNQVKGRNMYGTFVENELHTVFVEGGGQIVYFPTGESDTPQVIGHNKGESSNIRVTVKDNKISRIRLEKEPNSVYAPISMANEKDFILEGFQWNPDLRPGSVEDIFSEE